jgi:predicted metal-binding protein
VGGSIPEGFCLWTIGKSREKEGVAKKKYITNYSIENIAQSIVKDNPTGKRYGPEDKRMLYEERLQFLEDFPQLKAILSLDHIHTHNIPKAKMITHLAIIPPEIIVVDSRIQDMCYLPYWTFYGSGEGSFGRCSGVGAFSCCPPFNLEAEKVQALLDKANIFLALQFKPLVIGSGLGDPGEQFRILNLLADEIETLLGKGAVIQKFGGGPCFACYPEVCLCEGKCRAPQLKIPSLEGMGVCVDQLCKDIAFLTGNEKWKITWIKGFGTDDQVPKKSKGTLGLAITVKP